MLSLIVSIPIATCTRGPHSHIRCGPLFHYFLTVGIAVIKSEEFIKLYTKGIGNRLNSRLNVSTVRLSL